MKTILKVSVIMFFLLGFSLVVYADVPTRPPTPSGEIYEAGGQSGPILTGPGIELEPWSVPQNGDIFITAYTFDVSGVESTSAIVKAHDLEQTVGTVVLYDDGDHGDGQAYDDVFAGTWNAGSNPDGDYLIDIAVSDWLGNENYFDGVTIFTIATNECNVDSDCTDGQVCCSGTCFTPLCSVDADCDDGNPGTTDTCNTMACPNVCEYTPITGCIDNDGFCPAGCDMSNDNDCSDTTPPVISFVTPPSDNYEITDDVYTVTVNATDAESGMAYVDFYLDTSLLGSQIYIGNDTYDWIYDFSGVTNGVHLIRVDAYNNASPQLSTTVTRNINLNLPPGDPTALIDSPVNGSVVQNIVSVQITVDDPDGAVVEARLFNEDSGYIGNVLISPPAAAPTTVNINWDTTGYPSDGTKQCIYAQAYDDDLPQNYGRSPTICVTPDNAGPVIDFTTAFTEGLVESLNNVGGGTDATFPSWPNGRVTVAVDAADPVSGIKQVVFYRNGFPAWTLSGTPPPYQWQWDTDAELEGSSYTLFVEAYDGLDHASRTAEITVIVGHCYFWTGGCDYKAGYQCCLPGDNICSMLCGAAVTL